MLGYLARLNTEAEMGRVPDSWAKQIIRRNYHDKNYENYPVQLSLAKQIIIRIIMNIFMKIILGIADYHRIHNENDDDDGEDDDNDNYDDDDGDVRKYLSSTDCCEKSTSSCKGEEKHLVIVNVVIIIKFQDRSNNHFATGTIEQRILLTLI